MAASPQHFKFESLSNTLKVYPNPATGTITMELGEHDYQLVELLDMNGRMIRRWNISKGDRRFTKPVDFLGSGTYILRLEGRAGSKSVQFIKL
jgi:hypothetical protein